MAEWLLVSDLDGTMIGDNDALNRLSKIISNFREKLIVAFNSGRTPASMRTTINRYSNLPFPDYLIGALGTEIEYGPSGIHILDFRLLIDEDWDRVTIVSILEKINLRMQIDEDQTPHKISYWVNKKRTYEQVVNCLDSARIRAKVVYTDGIYLDIIPIRAGKGQAIEYLRNKILISPQNVIVAGDSDNDLDMFITPYKGIIVGNATGELKRLKGENIYHSKKNYADGVIDGLEYWGIFSS